MWTIFELGTFWSWALLLVASILIMWAAEAGSGVWASVTMAGTIAILYFLGNSTLVHSVLDYAKNNPLPIVIGIAAYFLVGTIWSVVKWYLYLIDKRDSYKDSGMTPRIPQVSDHKSTFLLWMMYWPFSGFWTIIDNPVKRGFSFIFSKMKNKMQLMANKVFEPIMEKKKEV